MCKFLPTLHNTTFYRQAVIWNYDIFGFNAGRTRQMVDLLAASGFLVLLPDYFRGVAPVSTRIRYSRFILPVYQGGAAESVLIINIVIDFEHRLKNCPGYPHLELIKQDFLKIYFYIFF